MKSVLLILLLTGCASASKTYTPDGSEGYSLNCSGGGRNWGMCYEKAGELCKERGYTVVAGGSDSNAIGVADRNGAFASSTNTRNMIIKCK